MDKERYATGVSYFSSHLENPLLVNNLHLARSVWAKPLAHLVALKKVYKSLLSSMSMLFLQAWEWDVWSVWDRHWGDLPKEQQSCPREDSFTRVAARLVLFNTSFSKGCLWCSQRGYLSRKGDQAAAQSTGVSLSAPDLAVSTIKDRGWQHTSRHLGNIAGAELECALPGTATDWQEDGLNNLMNLFHLSPLILRHFLQESNILPN